MITTWQECARAASFWRHSLGRGQKVKRQKNAIAVTAEHAADPYLSRTVQASAQPPLVQPQSGQTNASTRLVSLECLREFSNFQSSRASRNGDVCSTTSNSMSSNSSSSSGHNGMHLRRKVLRHKNGATLVCDESSQSDVDSVGNAEFLPLPVASGEDSGSVIESEVCSMNNGHAQVLPRSAPAAQRFAGCDDGCYAVGCDDGCYAVNYPSLIRPMEHPHTRNLKKMDPVARYFEYKEEWENFQPPGENARKHLRWQIREQMWDKSDVFQKPQHAVTVNQYVVPTEKKRLALRWEVRHDLAQGVMPRTFYSPL
uniref:centriolar and ciliogenesis-associated protein HYLS1 isoform X3 n=1 Tax=Myxine glutinosa TaxID=7769 RepID=UPI00358F56F5